MGLKPNINGRGRLARAITGILTLALGAAAWLLQWPDSAVTRTIIVVVCIGAGLFQLFEARRGWCVMRACGIRTPM